MNLTSKLRYASALAGFALAVSVPGIASADNFAGTWSFSGRMGNREIIAPVCVFRQSGNTLGGSCKGAAGIGSVTGGGVNGARITWRWNRIATSSLQRTSFVTFFGVLGPRGISGTWTDSVQPGGVGAFSGYRV
jgi:hypothetical protein